MIVLFFPKQSFCEMILERLLLLPTSIVQNLVMRLTMNVFLSFTANTTNHNKNKGKKTRILFFSRTIQDKQRDVNICFEFILSPFLSKSFFFEERSFLDALSKVYKLIQHNQVLPVSPLTF